MGLALSGLGAFFLLPVAPLPSVDLPVIFVMAQMPGASPETMSSSVATPLERHLGAIADVDEMTSSSSVGSTSVVLQFGLDRDIDGAARDVQAAINAARADLPAALRSTPTYRKINPADQPVLILALTSDTLSPGQIYDSASTILQQKLSQLPGIGQVQLGGSSLPAVRVDLNPRALFKYGIGFEGVRAALTPTRPRVRWKRARNAIRFTSTTKPVRRPISARWSWPIGTARRSDCRTSARSMTGSRMCAISAWRTASRRSS
jgi:multidrug efflux pump